MAAFHYAAYGTDVAKARAWLDLADGAQDKEGVQAVILHLEGDTEQAITHLDDAIAVENAKRVTRFDTGVVRQERAWRGYQRFCVSVMPQRNSPNPLRNLRGCKKEAR